MAVPELVLCENVAQKLDFPVVISIKLLKHENIHAQNTLIYQENKKPASCILSFPLLTLGIQLNPFQKSRLSLTISASIVLLAFAHSPNALPAYTHINVTISF